MRMFHIGVTESCEHRLGKLFQFLLRQGQRRNHFLKDCFPDKAQNQLVLHGLQHDIVTAQIGSQHKGGMSAVQDTDLPLLVRFLVIREDNRQSCFGKRQFSADILSALNHPEGKGFTRDNQMILIPELLTQFFRLISGIAGNDSCLLYTSPSPRDRG